MPPWRTSFYPSWMLNDSVEFGFMEMYKRLVLPKGCMFRQRNVTDKLGSGRGTSHTEIFS